MICTCQHNSVTKDFMEIVVCCKCENCDEAKAFGTRGCWWWPVARMRGINRLTEAFVRELAHKY